MTNRDSNAAMLTRMENMRDELAGMISAVRAGDGGSTQRRRTDYTSQATHRKELEKPFRLKKNSQRDGDLGYHKLGDGIICDTEAKGRETPGGRNIAELKLDASAGFIPLWDQNVTLNWRFQERSLEVFENPDDLKAKIEELFANALVKWGDAAPVKFTKEDDAWDFEIMIKPDDSCNIAGCVLASAFFPDAGRHQLAIYPKMFEQSGKEQVETLIHEIGHTFGLRHFFADVKETAFPSVNFGSQNPFTIMNYGSMSELTDADKSDLTLLYEKVWSGDLTEINGTEIRLMRPFHDRGSTPRNARAIAFATSFLDKLTS